MKGLDSMIGTTGYEDIESEVKLVGWLWSRGWKDRSWEQGVRNWTHLFQLSVVSKHPKTVLTGDTVVE